MNSKFHLTKMPPRAARTTDAMNISPVADHPYTTSPSVSVPTSHTPAPFSEPSDAYYRTLLQRLPLVGPNQDQAVRVLGVTSCYSGEGVTTVTSRLAQAAAGTAGRHVLVIDANTARPAQHLVFHVARTPGLSDLLLGEVDLDEAIRPTACERLSVISAGLASPELAQAWDSPRVAQLLAALHERFNPILIDFPNVAETGPASRLSALADGVVLVMEAERVRWEVAQESQKTLSRSGARLLGVVMNKQPQHIPDWLYRTL